MEKIIVLFGNFTFHHFTPDELKLFIQNTERKALLHQIHIVFEVEKEVDKLINELENKYESWLVPSEFKGEIVYEPDPKRNDYKNLVEPK